MPVPLRLASCEIEIPHNENRFYIVAGMTFDVDVAVVGAGPGGLGTVLNLLDADPGLRHGMLVVDPSGSWLHRWRWQMEAMGISHLRSPATHHPHPDPWQFRKWCMSRPSGLVMRDGYEMPATRAFQDFVDETIVEHDLSEAVTPDHVETVTQKPSGAVVRLANAGPITCRRVVLATASRRKRLGVAFRHFRDRRVVHAEDVDLPSLELSGRRVLVIGGALSAAHLVIGANDAGAEVTMAVRDRFRVRKFDVEPGWMGPKYLDGFNAETDRSVRRRIVSSARDGGTLPPWARRELAKLAQRGSLRVILKAPPTRAWIAENGVRVQLGEEDLEFDHVWLATGFETDLTEEPTLHDLLQTQDVPIHQGLPEVDHELRLPGTDIHLVGGLAALELGPAAANLHGLRRAGLRVAHSIVPNYEPVYTAHLH